MEQMYTRRKNKNMERNKYGIKRGTYIKKDLHKERYI